MKFFSNIKNGYHWLGTWAIQKLEPVINTVVPVIDNVLIVAAPVCTLICVTYIASYIMPYLLATALGLAGASRLVLNNYKQKKESTQAREDFNTYKYAPKDNTKQEQQEEKCNLYKATMQQNAQTLAEQNDEILKLKKELAESKTPTSRQRTPQEQTEPEKNATSPVTPVSTQSIFKSSGIRQRTRAGGV